VEGTDRQANYFKKADHALPRQDQRDPRRELMIEPDMAQDRLTLLQHQLIDLVNLLDPNAQRFPSPNQPKHHGK
jgi:hypothetical protein